MPRHEQFDPHPEDLIDQAFLIWLLDADRNCARTARLLAEHEQHLAQLEGREPRRTPARQIIWGWERTRNWDRQAQEYFAVNAPDWYHRHLGRSLMLLDRGAIWEDLLLRPPGDAEADAAFYGVKPEFLLQERMKALRTLRETTGVGMFGQKVARPDIPLPQGVSDGESKTALERAERTRMKALQQGKKP